MADSPRAVDPAVGSAGNRAPDAAPALVAPVD
ncbi:hypothetical protein FBY35_2391 [Streptomyces sp. SLBN-118]|nr:hypothetical protein FBY35_2391 [Streptomyces sp. SLBN-118]